MDYGVHLPLIAFNGEAWSLPRLQEYSATAARLGYQVLAANDHLLFPKPWLDGPAALASVLSHTMPMTLMTTVALPVLRGPIPTAKVLAAIDVLSGGRLIVGLGAGSSARDYASVDIPFVERWRRFDEAILALRALWCQGSGPFRGRFYSTVGTLLEPYPTQVPSPPIWLGSWGSDAGLRRTARLGDGWLASAYNTTPQVFARAKDRLGELLRLAGKDPQSFPNAISTMFLYLTEDAGEADRIIGEVLIPALNRPEAELRARLLVGPIQECAEKLAAYREAGAQRVLLWPIHNELRQITMFRESVATLVGP